MIMEQINLTNYKEIKKLLNISNDDIIGYIIHDFSCNIKYKRIIEKNYNTSKYTSIDSNIKIVKFTDLIEYDSKKSLILSYFDDKCDERVELIEILIFNNKIEAKTWLLNTD